MFVACALFWSGLRAGRVVDDLFAKRHVDRFVGGFRNPRAGLVPVVQPASVIVRAGVFGALGEPRAAQPEPGRAS